MPSWNKLPVDGDYDSEDDMQRPALPVDTLSVDETHIFARPPVSADEYLRWVRIEAQRCARVVHAECTPHLRVAPTMRVRARRSAWAPPELLPDPEWARELARSFESRRDVVSKKRAHQVCGGDAHSVVPIPARGDDGAWRSLCDDASLDEKVQLALIEQLDQVGLRAMIACVYSVLCKHRRMGKHGAPAAFPKHVARWFYLLLLYLEKPLPAESCAVLRDVYLLIAQVRSELHAEHVLLPEVNVILVIISECFGQLIAMESK